jgi:hypothetical protein
LSPVSRLIVYGHAYRDKKVVGVFVRFHRFIQQKRIISQWRQ